MKLRTMIALLLLLCLALAGCGQRQAGEEPGEIWLELPESIQVAELSRDGQTVTLTDEVQIHELRELLEAVRFQPASPEDSGSVTLTISLTDPDGVKQVITLPCLNREGTLYRADEEYIALFDPYF